VAQFFRRTADHESLLSECLGEDYGKVLLLDETVSEEAAARGAASLYERALQLGTVSRQETYA
jgi:hypothetical protein